MITVSLPAPKPPVEYPVARQWEPTGSIWLFLSPSRSVCMKSGESQYRYGEVSNTSNISDENWVQVDLTISG